MRFDITAIPWRCSVLKWRFREYRSITPQVVSVVSVHKETGEASVLCAGRTMDKDKSNAHIYHCNDPRGVPAGEVPGQQFLVREVTKNAEGNVKSAELVILVTQR